MDQYVRDVLDNAIADLDEEIRHVEGQVADEEARLNNQRDWLKRATGKRDAIRDAIAASDPEGADPVTAAKGWAENELRAAAGDR